MTRILNTRILGALAMIVFVGAIVASSTGAFFSDTETSTGNTFTAGAIDLKIDSVAHYNGMVCAANGETYIWVPNASAPLDLETMQPVLSDLMNEQSEWDAFNTANPLQYPKAGVVCTGTWPLADLGDGELAVGTFFDFDDIKPGDEGENTVSIHIDTNDAWMCAELSNVAEADNGQTEPEAPVDPDADVAAELDNNLHFFAWRDDGDNIFEDGETPLGGPVAASTLVNQKWALADSTTGNGPIVGDVTSYIGVYWCAGTISVVGNTLSCSGAEMGNEAQTDSWSADLSFYVEQSRNNANFRCNPVTQPETAALTVDKEVTFSSVTLAVGVGDFTLHISNGAGIDQDVTDETQVTGLPAGTYTVTEIYTGSENITFDAEFGGACTDNGSTGSVTLAEGDNLTCTITNSISPVDPV